MHREPRPIATGNPFTRRDFVKASAALSMTAAMPAWAARRSADPIRVGLIGCGGRGTGAAAQALSADPDAVLHAMGDMFPDRLASSLSALKEHAPDRLSVPPSRQFTGFDAYRQVIESDVDVVLLCTPPHFRPRHLEAAIGAGKHVFAEKPMAVDGPGIRRAMAAVAEARRKNLCVVSGFCWRYNAPERATFQHVLDGAVGNVLSVHTTYHTGPINPPQRRSEWSDMEWQLRNWWHYTWLSGDHIVEQACHSIDKIAWAMGNEAPIRATALGGRQARQGDQWGHAYDHFAVIYEYADGRRCFHTCRQIANTPFDNTDFITGSQGTCFINGWAPTHMIKDHSGQVQWAYEGSRTNMYQIEHDELFAAIRAGRPINDGDWMLRSTMMAILGRMAAYTGQTVTWEQAMASTEDLSPAQYAFGDAPESSVAIPGVTSLR